MAEYNNNNSYSKKDVSTDALSFFNQNMMLQTRMLESALSISFRPLVVDDNGKRTFPKSNDADRYKHSVLLTKENAELLLKRLNDSFIPRLLDIMETKLNDSSYSHKPISNGIFINAKNSTRVLDFYSGEIDKDVNPSLRLISDIGEDRVPAYFVEYTFMNAPVIEDYNLKTGEFQLYPMVPQLLLFKRVLEEFLKAITCGAGHSSSLLFKEALNHLIDTNDQIAIANNVQIVKYNAATDYNSNNNRPNTFVKTNNRLPGADIVEVASFDELASADLPF